MIYTKTSTHLIEHLIQPKNTDDPDNSNHHGYSLTPKSIYDSGSALIVYTTYEDLPNFYNQTQETYANIFEILYTLVKDDPDWRVQFDVIENLRIINKYSPKELKPYLEQFSFFLQRCIDNLRTNLSKNTLLFMKELFLHFKDIDPSEEFLSTNLSKVIEKAISDKAFIKNEARSALKTLEKTGCSNPVIKVLCDKTFDKNVFISEISFQTLAETIKEAKENLSGSLTQDYIELMFFTVAKTIDGKRAASKRIAEELCQQLKGGLPGTEAELEGYLKGNMKLKDYDAMLIVKAMQTKNVKAAPKADFSSFLKERRMKKELDVKEEENKMPEKSPMNTEDEL